MGRMFFILVAVLVLLSSNSFAAAYGGGSGTAASPYLIYTAAQMNTIGLNSGDWGKCFKLMANINMASYTGTQYHIIGNETAYFFGTFDGNGYVIRNLTYSSTIPISHVGLFGYFVGGMIKNLGVVNINLNVAGINVGGLVGEQYGGNIVNCYTTGTIISSYSTASYTYCYTGGLVGWTHSSALRNCHSTVSVTSSSYSTSTEANPFNYAGGLVGIAGAQIIANCYSTGAVTSISSSSRPAYANAGGLVGEVYSGTVTSCYSTGAVSASSSPAYSTSNAGGLAGRQDSSIEKSYSTGSVSATGTYAYKGGLVGYCTTTPTACFWDTQISTISDGVGNVAPDPAGAMGKTTAEMQTLSIFTAAGWDFTNETANGINDIWRMCDDGVDYPRLNWESIDGDFACPDGVAMEDFSYLARRWQRIECVTTGDCEGADMNLSNAVDMTDLMLFIQYWLEGA